jgi:hypothetical protein
MTALAGLAGLICVGMAPACGEGHRTVRPAAARAPSPARSAAARPPSPAKPSPAKPAKGSFEGDTDAEGDREGRDVDDGPVVSFGRPAGVADTRAVRALLKRYFAAARAADGSVACSLLYPTIAESIVETVGWSTSPLRGETCPIVLSKVLRQAHGMFARSASIKLVQLRVKAKRGLALLDVGRKPVRNIVVQRDHEAWKVKTLTVAGMP